MKPGYEPKDLHDAIAHLGEEASEVTKECLKTLRFGLKGRSPETPDKENWQRIIDELQDLEKAVLRYRKFLAEEFAQEQPYEVHDFGTDLAIAVPCAREEK